MLDTWSDDDGCWADVWDDDHDDYRTCEDNADSKSTLGLCAEHEAQLLTAMEQDA